MADIKLKDDTFIVAKVAGDQTFLTFIHDRLHFVHGESENLDYMHTLRTYIRFFHDHGADIQKMLDEKARRELK